ncbi:unnamed protein product [Amoebophrya sp. A120]|nr:unnamed protein product [Amoebophrya sp. A120]|eukprot:GSA120T00021222001.1
MAALVFQAYQADARAGRRKARLTHLWTHWAQGSSGHARQQTHPAGVSWPGRPTVSEPNEAAGLMLRTAPRTPPDWGTQRSRAELGGLVPHPGPPRRETADGPRGVLR